MRTAHLVLVTLLGTFSSSVVLADKQTYIFSAPPRASAVAESKIFTPVARYLSRVTGKQISYEHPGDWLNYQRNMQKGRYDIVFDGPHFVAWRMARYKHEPLARLPGKLVFVVIAREGNTVIKTIKDLAGRTVCGLAPPNLATLTLQEQFPNPVRQPSIVQTRSFKESYEKLQKGKCVAAVLRDKMLKKFDASGVKVVFKSQGVANQTFSVGARFSKREKKLITEAIMSTRGLDQMRGFHSRFNRKYKPLASAKPGEFRNLWTLLKDVWGFDLDQSSNRASL